MKKRTNWLIAAGVVLGVALVLLYTFGAQTGHGARRLADGSWLKVEEAVVAEELSRDFPDGNSVQRALAWIVPDRWATRLPRAFRSKLFPQSGASVHLSGEGKACLFILTGRGDMPTTGDCKLQEIAVDDGHGHGLNTSACQVTVEANHERIQGWALENAPGDCKTLRVRCFAARQNNRPAEVARFMMPNPAYGRGSP